MFKKNIHQGLRLQILKVHLVVYLDLKKKFHLKQKKIPIMYLIIFLSSKVTGKPNFLNIFFIFRLFSFFSVFWHQRFMGYSWRNDHGRDVDAGVIFNIPISMGDSKTKWTNRFQTKLTFDVNR
jgi:hypothetical protein